METAAPRTSLVAQVKDQRPVNVNDVVEDIETMKGVIAFLIDVGCTGAFSRDNGLGISPEGEIGLTFILRSVVDELDKISSCCAANLQPKASN